MEINIVTYEIGKKDKPKREYKGKNIIDLPNDYIVVDIETTGLDTEYCDIIELSAIKVKNSVIVDSYSSLVKPDSYYRLDKDDETNDFCIVNGRKIAYVDDFITKLTGITNKMLENAPTIQTVLPEFRNFIGDSLLVGHNVNFDINFLYDAFMSVFKEPLCNNFIDTMRFSRKLFYELDHHRLYDTAGACCIDYRGAHRAGRDCEITYSCFEKIRTLVLSKYPAFVDFQKLFTYGGKRIDCSSITATISEFDEEHPLYNKTVVFTGALSGIPRKEAMQSVVNVGGLIADNVTKNTNYLVIGSFDFIKSVKGDKTSKMIKAEKMRLDGYDITVVSENTFFELLENR